MGHIRLAVILLLIILAFVGGMAAMVTQSAKQEKLLAVLSESLADARVPEFVKKIVEGDERSSLTNGLTLWPSSCPAHTWRVYEEGQERGTHILHKVRVFHKCTVMYDHSPDEKKGNGQVITSIRS